MQIVDLYLQIVVASEQRMKHRRTMPDVRLALNGADDLEWAHAGRRATSVNTCALWASDCGRSKRSANATTGCMRSASQRHPSVGEPVGNRILEELQSSGGESDDCRQSG